MISIKKLAAFGLITGSVMLSILIISDNPPEPPTLPSLQTAQTDNRDSRQPLNLQTSSIEESAAMETKDVSSEKTAENITNQLAQKIAENLMRQNPDTSDPDLFIQQYLAENAQKFDSNQLKPLIEKEHLNIVQNAGNEFKNAYLKNVNQLLSSALAKFNSAGGLTEQLQFLASLYENAIQSLYQLSIPEQLADYHQKTLGILTEQKSAINEMLKYNEDPLRALLALQTVIELNQELTKLMPL